MTLDRQYVWFIMWASLVVHRVRLCDGTIESVDVARPYEWRRWNCATWCMTPNHKFVFVHYGGSLRQYDAACGQLIRQDFDLRSMYGLSCVTDMLCTNDTVLLLTCYSLHWLPLAGARTISNLYDDSDDDSDDEGDDDDDLSGFLDNPFAFPEMLDSTSVMIHDRESGFAVFHLDGSVEILDRPRTGTVARTCDLQSSVVVRLSQPEVEADAATLFITLLLDLRLAWVLLSAACSSSA